MIVIEFKWKVHEKKNIEIFHAKKNIFSFPNKLLQNNHFWSFFENEKNKSQDKFNAKFTWILNYTMETKKLLYFKKMRNGLLKKNISKMLFEKTFFIFNF